MKTFKKYINESIDNNLESLILAILNNTHFNKNVKGYDNELYFEIKNAKGATNLAKKLIKKFGDYDIVNSITGGKIGYYSTAELAILGYEAKAYICLSFNGKITKEALKLSNGKIISKDEFLENHAEITKK